MSLVPKVHPATREVESDDPMELVAEPAPGDPNEMLDCLIHEFTWMGYGPDRLVPMFRDPEYPVLNQLRDYFGDAEIARRVEESLTGWESLRVTEEFDDTPEPGDEDDLIELTVRRDG
jgi:hypothetical protein